MNDPEKYLAEHETKRDVFGAYGGQFGPIMVSTNRTLVTATAKIFVAIGLFGYAVWQILSLSLLSSPARWVIVGVITLIGLSTIHVILIEVYTTSARKALEPLVGAKQVRRRRTED